jgi:hypothetical protein
LTCRRSRDREKVMAAGEITSSRHTSDAVDGAGGGGWCAQRVPFTAHALRPARPRHGTLRVTVARLDRVHCRLLHPAGEAAPGWPPSVAVEAGRPTARGPRASLRPPAETGGPTRRSQRLCSEPTGCRARWAFGDPWCAPDGRRARADVPRSVTPFPALRPARSPRPRGGGERSAEGTRGAG